MVVIYSGDTLAVGDKTGETELGRWLITVVNKDNRVNTYQLGKR